MNISKLESLSAFSPGSKLWIVADQKSSRWAEIIDWELGFQLTRADHHKDPIAAKRLEEIVKAVEMKVPSFSKDKEAPLMVASTKYLPNTFTVKVPYEGEKAKWLKSVASVWANLNFPPLRVFLPKGIEFDDFKKQWAQKDVAQEISVVLDSSAAH
jgi:hypothetical protein